MLKSPLLIVRILSAFCHFDVPVETLTSQPKRHK